MSTGTLLRTARLLDARYEGPDLTWQGLSTDSRTLDRGMLFVGLNGPNFRGADFVADAMTKGAVAAVVDTAAAVDLPQIVVHDTRHALGVIAADWRARFDAHVIGVTGSNGKTTVKQLIAALLGPAAYATPGNLNNAIGVPLSLLGLEPTHTAAVIEMGANALGEIAYLTSLVQPDVGLVTNAGPAHLEGFGSQDGVAEGKGELFYALRDGATAIINRDDVYFERWCEMAEPATIVSFALEASADFSAADIALEAHGSHFTLHGPDFVERVYLPLAGGHNVANACAAAASAWAAGIAPPDIVRRLGDVKAAPARLRQGRTRFGGVLIDDTYNANPASVRAAAEHGLALRGEMWMALGDMGELGSDGQALHAALGRDLAAAGVAQLLVVGPLMRHAAEAFGSGALVFDDHATMIRHLEATLTSDIVLIVKGSRSARMEIVVEALTAATNEVTHA